ncbi:MAG: hypothetical protein E7352_02905 [Clostridiales bacterium]|nr:hypothetical protein [Clostridiales bacterium]
MQRTVEKVFFALLRFEINGTELCDDVKNLITAETLPALFKLSKKHDLAHLIGDALQKNGLLPDDSEAKKRFVRERNLAIYRYERIQYDFEQICEILKKAEIKYIPLKGSVVRQYYPEPWMRTSCDIDILVAEEDLDRAIARLVEDGGYEKGEKCFHDVSLASPCGVHLELHYNLVEKDEKLDGLLANAWGHTATNDNLCHLMTNEYLLFYLLAHMKHHFMKGGCGVRPFIDLYLLTRFVEIDRAVFADFCEQGGVSKLAEECLALSQYWFGEGAGTALTEKLSEYILTGGVYGSTENKVMLQQAKSGGRFKYILSRIWLPYQWLKYSYPSLEGKRWLTFFYQIRRWCSIIFKRKKVKKGLNEMSLSQQIDKRQQEETKKLLQALEL